MSGFASYLVSHKRFYEVLNADFDAIPRREFARYLAWVAGNLDNLRFGRPVREVRFEDGLFHIRLDDDACMARNLSLGVGLKPNIPAWGQVAHGQSCFHTSEAAYGLEGFKGRRIVVVGGGQSGAVVAFFAFLVTRSLFLVLAARDFAVAFLVTRAGDAFFVFLAFFEDFFLAVATTESFADRNEIVGSVVRRMCLRMSVFSDECAFRQIVFRLGVYRVASASIENTEKTSGLRPRL